MNRARIGSALVLLFMLLVMIPIAISSNTKTAEADAPLEAVSCKIDNVTGSVAHIVCFDILGNIVPGGLDVSLPQLPGATITLPPVTETVTVPGPTVTIPGPETTITIAPPTVTLPPLPNATITLPGVTLPPIRIPGPTSTVTIIPGNTLTPKPNATVTKTVQVQGPVVKRTVTASPSSQPTATATVTRQPAPSSATIEPGPRFDQRPELNIIQRVGLGFLAILLIAGLIIAGMWGGYYLGFKESDAKEANFLKALLGK